ncbi:STY4534 family ICE replication protein [Pseudomonas sp. B392_1p]|uniref:STY4534 family ICE replication protein n=1 Tax=Pseudomonas sp. B392_1p TaxID=3457507 RepID=UPI003FD5FCE1
MTQNTSEEPKYFDLHARGIGYLNRIREVQVRRGPGFMACDIAALYGPADAAQYTRFDCKVSGAEAERLVRRCWDAVNAQKKVLVAFRIGDLWVDPFLYEKGEKTRQPGASLKARLLYLGWIKIDGQLVYKAEPRPQEAVVEPSKPEPAEAIAPQPEQSAPTPTPKPKPARQRARSSSKTKTAATT